MIERHLSPKIPEFVDVMSNSLHKQFATKEKKKTEKKVVTID